jgi:hypothetical protein
VKDFFCVKQRPIYYAIALMFLLIVFGLSIIRGEVIKGQSWLILPFLFIRAILFGGIEEIGWRYFFQPALEQKYSFATSSVITFFAWAVWHMMFNVLDGTIFLMDANGFICQGGKRIFITRTCPSVPNFRKIRCRMFRYKIGKSAFL